MSSAKVIDELADIILSVCEKREEVEALIDNVLVLIAENLDDEEWEPTIRDIKISLQDKRDDLILEPEVDSEDDIEVIKDADGFVSLK